METNKNVIIAIALSLAVILGWNWLYVRPHQQAARQQQIEAQRQAEKAAQAEQAKPGGQAEETPQLSAAGEGNPLAPVPAPFASRQAAIDASPRIKIDSPALLGSINLKGGRIDDVTLRNYTTTVDPDSSKVTLLSPSGSPQPFYAKVGWLGTSGVIPPEDAVWKQEGNNSLTPQTPVVLTYDNGADLVFRRTISVDDRYMFTIKDEVENKGSTPVSLRPYGQVARLYEPPSSGYSVLHEGLVAVLGGAGLKEMTYANAIKNYEGGNVKETLNDKGGWLGFTDQYWATVLIPPQDRQYTARMFGNERKQFYADYLEEPVQLAPGEKKEVTSRLFAGAKEVPTLNQYESEGIDRFHKLIDWGWFPFLTQPMFWLMDHLYKLVGNFGVAILLTTVLVKLAFFPLANKSYASMSKMKLLQPEMKRLQERFKDDRARQQQALMELYRKEKVNPMSGCLPIFIQIPVFFALYKVLLVTIEMRHAPFVGWIRDLSAPDPTSVFNLFGLLPFTPPAFLMIGVLPLLMGISMWVQMRLNPTPPDPVQQQIFSIMPIMFTFMLAHFPAGLVLYWTWNNLLSFTQQAIIMKRQGSDVDLLHNLKIKGLSQRVQRLSNGGKQVSRPQKPAE